MVYIVRGRGRDGIETKITARITIKHFWEACELLHTLYWQASLFKCSGTASSRNQLKALLTKPL